MYTQHTRRFRRFSSSSIFQVVLKLCKKIGLQINKISHQAVIMFCTCTALEMRDTARKPTFVPDKKHARTEARDEVMQNPPTLDPEVTESLEYMITQSRNRTNVGAESTASRWLWGCARESSVCSNTRLVESWRRRRWLCNEWSIIPTPTCTWGIFHQMHACSCLFSTNSRADANTRMIIETTSLKFS